MQSCTYGGRMRTILGAALVVAASMTASPGAAQVETKVDVEPDWRRKPSSEDLMGVWPTNALRSGRGGSAVVNCKVTAQGVLFDCIAKTEKPAGAGFGAAAVALTPQFLMKPAMKNGKAVAYDGVNIPIDFKWPSGSRGGGELGGRTVVSNVVWREAPSYAEVVAVYPEKARAARMGGNVALSCIFKVDGRLRDCRVLGETPSGKGFGAAAKRLMPLFLGPEKYGGGDSIEHVTTQVMVTFPVEMIDQVEPLIGQPQWAALPSAHDLEDVIPPDAAKAGAQTARVLLTCKVAAAGRLEGCLVERETPEEKGFGLSALRLSRAFALTTWTSEGLPTIGGRVRVPIRFEIPSEDVVTPLAKP